MFYVTSEIYLNNDLGSLAVSVDNYPQKRKNHLTITYDKIKVSYNKHICAIILSRNIKLKIKNSLKKGIRYPYQR